MQPTPLRFAGTAAGLATAGALLERAFRGPDTLDGVPVAGVEHAIAGAIGFAIVAVATLVVVYLAARGSARRELSLRNAMIVGVLLECAQLLSAQFPVIVTIDATGVVTTQGGGPFRHALELVAVPAAITMGVLFVSRRRRN